MSVENTTFRGYLHHLELGSPDPERLARWYEKAFEMQVTKTGSSWLCRGPERTLLVSPGQAMTLVSAGYALLNLATLEGLRARLSAAGVMTIPAPTDIFGTTVAFRDPSANLIEMGLPRPAPSVESRLPGRLQHLVVATTKADAMVDFYTRVVGLRQSDRVLDDAGALRTCFMRTDDEHHSFAVFQTSENRLDHHCYEAIEWNAIRDWGDHFASIREPVKWGPGRHGPGNNLFLFVHDCDGNWVEISAELEIVAESRPVGLWAHEERTLNSWGQASLRT